MSLPSATGSTAPAGLATSTSRIAEQEAVFLRRQPRSAELVARARRSLAGGATSSWQIAEPQAVWLTPRRRVEDLRRRRHRVRRPARRLRRLAGGPRPPGDRAAVTERVARGTHFAQPTEDAIVVAEELARRFGLPLWRFGNSGTEATMDAVHLMRAATGRDLVIKVEGCYHGHHDSVEVSVLPGGGRGRPGRPAASVPGNTGIPQAFVDLVVVVGFNDVGAVARVLDEYPGQVAGMIVEPVMMNAGIIPPDPGYLEACATCCTSTARCSPSTRSRPVSRSPPAGDPALGVTPDIVCLAKALGGGLPWPRSAAPTRSWA